MPDFPFVGGAYQARSRKFDAQRAVNLYPEVSESGPGPSKSPIALIGTPGLALWSTLAGTGGVRGLLRFSPTVAVAVVGANVYRLDTAGTGTQIATIDPGTAPVSMASNGTLVAIATGAALYFVDPATGALTNAPYAADRVDFIDGYFVFNEAGTGRFRVTQLYGPAIDALDFATAEGAPDNLVGLIVDHREVWLFGQASAEVWFNSGEPDFPFSRIQGAFMEVGCAARNTIAKLDNSVFWLSADERGQGMVLRAAGYQPQRISTHAIEHAIGQYARIDDAVAFTYQQEGHAFYVLTFPTADRTWVYDAATNLWHERAWRNPTLGTVHRHRAQCQMAFAGETIVGDWQTGKLYRLDLDVYTDDGAPIPRIRTCPHMAADQRLHFFHAMQVDMEVGGGIPGNGQPQAMLRWSDDGGWSWSNEVWASIGRLGERRTRVRWRRLGKSRDRVFEVTITDPVKVVIVGASVEVTQGLA